MDQPQNVIEWLTAALVLVTLVYAWLTYKIMQSNREVVAVMRSQLEAQLRPSIVSTISPRVGEPLLLLTIQNTGRSSAENLRLTISKRFTVQDAQPRASNLADFPIFNEPIRSFPAGASVQFLLGVTHMIVRADEDVCPKTFDVRATYSLGTKIYEETTSIDLRPLLNSVLPEDPVAKAIGELRLAVLNR